MITTTNKRECCGCEACAQICPKQCISMTADVEGFLYPVVNEEACVQCGICRQACPMLRKVEYSGAVVEAYAAYSKDKTVRQCSSSGGVFSTLAEWVLQRNGAVFGAAFADDFSVHHVKIETSGELSLLRGSKYLQSRIEKTYSEAKAILESGRLVLFSGVGCQIAGLKSYLKKEYENLYTVDVLCHGVPSPLFWKRYLQEQERQFNAQVVTVSFRSKVRGWKKFSMEQRFSDGGEYCKSLSEDLFMQCFLRNICLRPSCHSCKFRHGYAGADLTLGDAWGIEHWMTDMDDNRGTSVVLVNSEKGRSLWEEVASGLYARQGDLRDIVRYNSVYTKSVRPHPNRKKFFRALNSGASMDELCHLAQRTFLQRCRSFAKRCVKKLLGR